MYPSRSSHNKNLKLTSAHEYRGMQIYQLKGPQVVNYLDRAYTTIQRAMEQYPRTLAIRVDLRFPLGIQPWWHGRENDVLGRFIASFRSKIAHDRDRARADNPYAHQSVVRYIWAREQHTGASPHFHCLLLLNQDAYRWLGDFRSDRENLANRIQAAWVSALGMSWAEAHSLVEFPVNNVYALDRYDRDIKKFESLFFRVSYLSKEATKSYGNGVHAFGSSRI